MKQLGLFAAHPPLPSRPFSRWSRKFDELRVCTGCGREIAVRRRIANDEIVSEYTGANGECWTCAEAGR